MLPSHIPKQQDRFWLTWTKLGGKSERLIQARTRRGGRKVHALLQKGADTLKPSSPIPSPAHVIARHPCLAYVAPFALFMTFTAIQPSGVFWPWIYPLKTVAVGSVLILLVRWYPNLNVGSTWFAGVGGVIVFVLWVLPEGTYPLLQTPSPVDPFENLVAPWSYWWVGFRVLGASVVVPIMEELFWRGFLIRWLINERFQQVTIGTFTWPSFVITSLLFASEHNRWLVGLMAGVVYNLILYRTKSLYACMIAHGVTNFALAIFVLATKQWTFW
jgi:CAAX prenyl protease-like protein